MASRRTAIFLAAATVLAAGALATAPDPAAAKMRFFDLRAPGFREFSSLTKRYAGNEPRLPGCDGGNVSPPLTWSGAPPATRSYAIELFDLAGNPPLGFVHWLAYGIPAGKTSLRAGEASAPSPAIVGGINAVGKDTYFGPCPPPGEKPHPFVFLLMATDLAPDALLPGLTRDQLAEALKGHVIDRTTLVLRYGD